MSNTTLQKNTPAPLAPRAIARDEENHHIEYIYDFYAKDLSYAFSALRKWNEKANLTASTLTMQKFPEVEHKKVKTRKKNKEGTPVYTDKIVEHKSDIRWVLSFDWKTKDPTEARCLEYHFYDDGWPGSATFMFTEDNYITLNDNDGNNDEDSARRFECTVTLYDREHSDEVIAAFEDVASHFSTPPMQDGAPVDNSGDNADGSDE